MVGGQLKEIEEVDMANIKKKAVTNLYGRLIKRLLGIGSVDFDDLSEAGINRSDVLGPGQPEVFAGLPGVGFAGHDGRPLQTDKGPVIDPGVLRQSPFCYSELFSRFS